MSVNLLKTPKKIGNESEQMEIDYVEDPNMSYSEPTIISGFKSIIIPNFVISSFSGLKMTRFPVNQSESCVYDTIMTSMLLSNKRDSFYSILTYLSEQADLQTDPRNWLPSGFQFSKLLEKFHNKNTFEKLEESLFTPVFGIRVGTDPLQFNPNADNTTTTLELSISRIFLASLMRTLVANFTNINTRTPPLIQYFNNLTPNIKIIEYNSSGLSEPDILLFILTEFNSNTNNETKHMLSAVKTDDENYFIYDGQASEKNAIVRKDAVLSKSPGSKYEFKLETKFFMLNVHNNGIETYCLQLK